VEAKLKTNSFFTLLFNSTIITKVVSSLKVYFKEVIILLIVVCIAKENNVKR